MSEYYNARRTRGLFDPQSDKSFKISRSKLELFTKCPRCFYLDVRRGIKQPGGFPFNLNSAVDHLLKKEFDIHRAKSRRHPLMEAYGIDAVPFAHEKLDEWRENFKGVQFHHAPTNLLITGAVDDLWQNPHGDVMVVDYKATSKDTEVTIDAEWQMSYKRQMEIYQWLLRRNGLTVSDTGYFVYCNGRRDAKAFDGKLEFDVKIIPYAGSDAWVEDAIVRAHDVMRADALPRSGHDCDFCAYRVAAHMIEIEGE